MILEGHMHSLLTNVVRSSRVLLLAAAVAPFTGCFSVKTTAPGSAAVERPSLRMNAQAGGAGDSAGATGDAPAPAPSSDEIDKEELGKKTANPLSDLWLLWFQNDLSQLEGDVLDDLGEDHQYLNSTKFQPVMSLPIRGGEWNLIVRPVLQYQRYPVNDNVEELFGASSDTVAANSDLESIQMNAFDDSTSGLGDTILMVLAGPNKLDGFVWGAGVTNMFPTASEEVLGSEQWAAGPALLMGHFAKNVGGFNYGILAQHWWSYAGDDDREDISSTDVQYFVNYRLSATEMVGTMPNIRYNWEADHSEDALTVPIGLGYSNIYFFGKLPIRMMAELQYSLVKPDNIGTEWNLRFLFVPIIPNLVKMAMGSNEAEPEE